MFNCITFYNSSKKYLQFPNFPDKLEIIVKSKMAATLADILDDVTDPQYRHNPKYLLHLVDHMTSYLLKGKYFPNNLTPQKPTLGV